MDFCQRKGRRYWTESETRIFRGAHSIEEYPLILPWENVCVFGWVLPCLLSLQSILPFTSLSNIDRNINLEPKGVTLTHPSCGWFENNKARHKTIIDNRNFSFSKSLFTLMQKLQKNVLSYSLCFSGRIWRTRQEGVSHRRRGFALHIWCKETRTAVDTQVPLFSEDHERTFFFPVDKKDQQCLNNDSSSYYEGLVPCFLKWNCLLCQFRMCIFFSFRFPPSLPFTSHVLHHKTKTSEIYSGWRSKHIN